MRQCCIRIGRSRETEPTPKANQSTLLTAVQIIRVGTRLRYHPIINSTHPNSVFHTAEVAAENVSAKKIVSIRALCRILIFVAGIM